MSSRGPEYIQFRLREAGESLQEAELLLQNGHLRTAVSRVYYACFYAAEALLLTEGQHSKKHSGVRSLLERHWIVSGRLPREMGRFYHQLLDSRLEADYEQGEFEQNTVAGWLEEARRFVDVLTTEAQKRLEGQPPIT